MKQVKLNVAFLAILLGAGIVFTQVIFNPLYKSSKKQVIEDYAYNGTDIFHTIYADFYTHITHHGDDPVCDNGLDLPCVLPVEGDLQTWLDAHTVTQIREAALATKSE